jgi:hypothetical protein
MNFTMTMPCVGEATCPFRTDCLSGWLGEERAEEIIEAIIDRQQTFACHKTTKHDEDGEVISHKDEQHCAGAMILLEKIERPNQMMRICERIGLYDRTKLQMDAPVFDDTDDFICHHSC